MRELDASPDVGSRIASLATGTARSCLELMLRKDSSLSYMIEIYTARMEDGTSSGGISPNLIGRRVWNGMGGREDQMKWLSISPYLGSSVGPDE